MEDFLCSNVGDTLLLQIALDHPHRASCSALHEQSGPKPLRLISGRTFVQAPCGVVSLHPCRAQLVDVGILDRFPPESDRGASTRLFFQRKKFVTKLATELHEQLQLIDGQQLQKMFVKR